MPRGGARYRKYATKDEALAARKAQTLAWSRKHREELNERRRVYRGGSGKEQVRGPTLHGRLSVASFRAPAEILAERDRILSQPQTLNMIFLGDPLPGRSALDRGSGTPSNRL